MRVLFLSSEHAALRGTGGVGSYVATITAAMAAGGHDVHVLSCRDGAERSDDVVDGVTIHVRPLVAAQRFNRVWPGWHTRQRARLAWTNYREARRLGCFDVVEAPDWQAEGLLFAVDRRTPLVVHIHTPHQVLWHYEAGLRGRDDRVADRLEQWTAKRAAAVTSPSQLVVDRLREIGWLTDRSVDIIRYPVDVSRFASVGPPADGSVVLAVGRLERRKSPELIVAAAALLQARGVPVSLRLVGRSSGERDGLPYAEWLAAEASRLGLRLDPPEELSWAEITQAYEDCAVVCVCSQFESFSMAAVEGMAAGRPVVMTPGIGAAEVITTAVEQRLRVATAEALAGALEPLLVDPERARAVGAANRSDVVAGCDPAKIAKERQQLFERLVARRRRR